MRILLCLGALCAFLEGEAFAEIVTLHTKRDGLAQTNLPADRTAKLLSFPYRAGAWLYVKTPSSTNSFTPLDLRDDALVVAGPVTLELHTTGEGGHFCTFDIQPISFPPDKTIVIPQGGSANIAMECSTNLIDWAPAPLGTYTNQPASKFFRLKAERLP